MKNKTQEIILEDNHSFEEEKCNKHIRLNQGLINIKESLK